MEFTSIRNLKRFNLQQNVKNVEKAYTEGIYSDTPANRKLGRVGMSYKEYSEKVNKDTNKEVTPKDLLKQIVSDLDWEHQYSKFGPTPYTVTFADGSKLEWDKNVTRPGWMEGATFNFVHKDSKGKTIAEKFYDDDVEDYKRLYSLIKDSKKELIEKNKLNNYNGKSINYSYIKEYPSPQTQDSLTKEFSKIAEVLKADKKDKNGFLFSPNNCSGSSIYGSVELDESFPGSDNKFFSKGTNFLQMMKNPNQKKYKDLSDLVIDGKKISEKDVELLKEALFDAGRNSTNWNSSASGSWGPISLIFNKCEINEREGGSIVTKMMSYVKEGKKYQEKLNKDEKEASSSNSKNFIDFINKGGKKTYTINGKEYEVESTTPSSFYIYKKDGDFSTGYSSNRADINKLIKDFAKGGLISSKDGFNISKSQEKSKYPWKK